VLYEFTEFTAEALGAEYRVINCQPVLEPLPVRVTARELGLKASGARIRHFQSR
jgi:hypothetical protein